MGTQKGTSQVKKYIGTKIVMATPETGEKAQTILGRELCFDNAEETDLSDIEENSLIIHEGYLVEYPDGYRSWSPKKQFEEAYGLYHEPYQQRAACEKKELDHKAAKLAEFISVDAFQRIDAEEKVRLESQLIAMVTYSDILGERIAAFD